MSVVCRIRFAISDLSGWYTPIGSLLISHFIRIKNSNKLTKLQNCTTCVYPVSQSEKMSKHASI